MPTRTAKPAAAPRGPTVLRSYWDGLAQLLELPERLDARGSLVEFDFERLPFVPRRSFVIHGNTDAVRGGHAHARGYQLLCCLSGAVVVDLRHGDDTQTVALSSTNHALLIGTGVWAQQHYSGPEAVLLVLASDPYDPTSYVTRRP